MAKGRNTKVSERQLRMLEQRAQGKTLSDIGKVFHISGEGARINIRAAYLLLRRFKQDAIPENIHTDFSVDELIAAGERRPKPAERVQEGLPATAFNQTSYKDNLLYFGRLGETTFFAIQAHSQPASIASYYSLYITDQMPPDIRPASIPTFMLAHFHNGWSTAGSWAQIMAEFDSCRKEYGPINEMYEVCNDKKEKVSLDTMIKLASAKHLQAKDFEPACRNQSKEHVGQDPLK